MRGRLMAIIRGIAVGIMVALSLWSCQRIELYELSTEVEFHLDMDLSIKQNINMNKDPMNTEYKNAFMAMQQNAGGYRNMNTGNMSQDDCCNCCSNLICADCLCECMGGDLIPCC